MGRETFASCDIEVAGLIFRVTGSVWLGTTPPNGDDPTEVSEWHCDVSRDALLESLWAATLMTRAECAEEVERRLCDAARRSYNESALIEYAATIGYVSMIDDD